MTPSTLVRRPRLPFTFTGFVGMILDREPVHRQRSRLPTCCRLQADGSPCGLPALYISIKDGGPVCRDHRPARREAAAV